MNAICLPTSFTSNSWKRERMLREYTKLIAMGTEPFYASDAGLSGGTIGAMHRNNWVAKTGNAKKAVIQIDAPIYGKPDPIFPWYRPIVGYEQKDYEVEIFEWKIVDFPRATQMLALMEQMDKLMKGE